MKKDYYEILGVTKDASQQDIKKKYRSLALKNHPDRVPADQKKEAEERFKEISEAYGVLADPQKRKVYDQYGHAGIDQNFTTDDIFRGADFSSVFGEEFDVGSIFRQFFAGGSSGFDFFGGGRGGQRFQRGRDIQYETDVTLEEAFTGISKEIRVPRYEFCKPCDGSGAKAGSKKKKCPTCNGRGQVMMSSGFFRLQQTCSACGGQGEVITEYCPECQGKGMVRVTRKIKINVPPGVDNTSRLRIRGEGEIGRDGAGDLYLYIHVLPHDVFKREGTSIYLELPISFVKAALGGEVSVPTLNGNVSMKVPLGTQSGKVFRLKGKGMPDVHGGPEGDQYVQVMLHVPERLSAEQKKLLEEYARVSGEEVGLKTESIKEKIKKVFK